MLRVMLQDGHDEHQPLEIAETQNSAHSDMSIWTIWTLIDAGDDCSGREGVRHVGSRLQFTNCILDYYSLRPGTCPFAKNAVTGHTVFKTSDKASFGCPVVVCEQKGKLIQLVDTLIKDCVKILVSGVWTCFALLKGGRFSHLFSHLTTGLNATMFHSKHGCPGEIGISVGKPSIAPTPTEPWVALHSIGCCSSSSRNPFTEPPTMRYPQ